MKLIEQIKSKDIFFIIWQFVWLEESMEIEKRNNGIGPYIQWRVWIIDEIKKGAGANKLGNMIRFESFGNDDELKSKMKKLEGKWGVQVV